jgi:outer membrane receptor protein involved in Fe transport
VVFVPTADQAPLGRPALTDLARILTGIALLLLSIGTAAPASPNLQVAETVQFGEEEPLALESLRVTGYHVERMGFEGPAPVVVFTHDDLEQAGINTLAEFARQLPLNWPEQTLRFDSVGAAAFDLRGLGIDATLTLVNGRRIAPYAQSAENYIDLNAIPVAAIERIEILKDGASAIYGADAIAGVVNIILREGFDGTEISAGYGISQQGDGEEFLADIVMGHDTGRGSVLFSLSGYDREPQAMADRDWSGDSDWSAIGGPNWRSAYGSPPTLFRYDTFTLEHDPACGTDPQLSSIRTRTVGDTVCGFNAFHDQDQFGSLERIGATLSGQYQIDATLSVFGDLLYSDTRGKARQSPQIVLAPAGADSWTGGPFVPAEHPHNPFGISGELLSRMLDAGDRVHDNEASNYRFVTGLEGLWAGWDWQLSGLYSRNEVKKTYRNLVYRSRYQQALLGMGGLHENLWYNPFGYQPANDPVLVDWLTTNAVQRDRAEEFSIDLLFNRSFGKLAGGSASVAVGLQYREQNLDQWADEDLKSGDLVYDHQPVNAKRDIEAAYVELDLPLLESLEAQVALRYEDYSDFGSTTNPKIALRWQPLKDLMLRASWSTSFKPPSFYELYLPQQQSSWWYRDVARCEATGLAEDCEEWTYPIQWGGNPDLDPEEGESWFVGMLWTPDSLPGFEFQLDFWKFQHDKRIEYLDVQHVLNEKGDHGVVRAPTEPDGTPGKILQLYESWFNAESLQTRGFDTTLRYAWTSKTVGDFRVSLMHSYIDQWTFTGSLDSGIVNQNFAGRHWGIAVPRNRANINLNWDKGPLGAALNVHYTGHYTNHTNLYVDGEWTDQPMIISDHTTVDLQYKHVFVKLKNAILRIGCNNVANRDPPLNYGALEPFHDGRGRFFYIRWQQPIL